MAFLRIFRKKIKKEEKPAEVKKKKPVEVKPQQPSEAKPSEAGDEAKPQRPPKARERKIISEAYHVLKTPHVTEKATDLTKQNQYIFKAWPKANKVEIKKAIEDLYGVDVLSVKIINIPPKRRRLGRIRGWRKGYKKAIVRIKEGQKIEVLPR